MKKKAIIISIKAYTLNKEEKKILKNEKPWGLILFKRNIKNFTQLKTLIRKIRIITKDKKFPILIDEEGETVSRLVNIFKNKFTQNFFGDIYKYNPKLASVLYKNYIKNLTTVLKKVGININTVPVLDVLRKSTHNIIGKRSFSESPLIVKRLGQMCVKNYKLNKIFTVIKHIPGHGCSSSDSHLKTPRVNLSFNKLKSNDFSPFKSSTSLFAMTAHVIYSKIDNKNVATFSKKIVSEIIRKKIGFKGILISDDISMKALKYNLLTNAQKSLAAGCNIILYCGGNHKDTLKLIKKIPFIDQFTLKKTSEFYKQLG